MRSIDAHLHLQLLHYTFGGRDAVGASTKFCTCDVTRCFMGYDAYDDPVFSKWFAGSCRPPMETLRMHCPRTNMSCASHNGGRHRCNASAENSHMRSIVGDRVTTCINLESAYQRPIRGSYTALFCTWQWMPKLLLVFRLKSSMAGAFRKV